MIDAATKGYINVAEAKRIQNVFNKKMRSNQDGEIAPINGPQSNLFIIAS